MTKKTTTKAKTKTSQAAKTSRVTITSRQTLALPKLQWLTVGVLTALAVAAGVLMSSVSYVITVSYLTLDKQQANALAPAYRHYLDLPLKWVLISALAVAVLGQLLHLTRMKQTFAASLKTKRNTWRWVGLAVVGALMTEIVALVSGYQDMVTLKLLGLTAVVTAVFGYCAEREALTDKAKAFQSHLAGLLSAAVTVLLIGFSLLYTPVFGQIRASWYVYAAYAVLVAHFALLSINQYNQLRSYKNWKNYEIVERNYIVIVLVTLVSLGIVLITGLPK